MLADKKYSDHNVFLYTTDQPEYLKPCLKTSSRAKSMQASSSLRQPPLKGQKCRIVTPNKSVGHSVASYEPFIQYHEAYDPFQTSGKGENYADNSSSSLLEGHIAQATVINDTSALKTQTHKSKKISEVKTAGISTTVVHVDPTEVYKHLQREDARKLDNPTSNSGFGQPFSTKFLTSPDAPYKRIDLVKQRKKMEQNSMALLRLKEKIQRQKQRSPSVDGSRKAEGFSPTNQVFLRPSTERNHDNHIIRKTAVGPVAPKYKGFSTTETRIQTPDGKVWKGGEAAAVRSYHPMKKPKAVSSLFESKQASKVHAASNSGKKKSKSANPIRKTGKVRLDHPTHKKSMITPSSWREGRRVAESILGPPPKQPKRIVATDVTKPDQNKELPSKPDPLLSAKPNQEKLSTIARGVLNDLGLGSEDEADNKKFDLSRRQREADRSRRPKKHQPTKVSGDSKIKMEKTRHYDQSEVQQYIAKQKADRKRKQSQERKANKDAYEKKQKQLDELYRKQKEAASAKRKLMASGGQLSKQQSTHEHVAGDWVVQEDDSDKENEENEQNVQGQSKFDERMSALMEKLDQYRPSTTQSTNSYKVPNKEPDKHFEYNNIPNSNMPSSSNTASEFMQKLDQYLKDDVPVPKSLGTKSRLFENAHREPEVHANLTIEDLDTQFSGKGTIEVENTNPPDNFVPRLHDQGLKQRLRCEKIAALKAKAESLQERINVESKRLVEQPFVPTKTSLQDVDAILRRSPRYPSIPPTNAWSPERIGSSSIPVSSIHIGVDVPDSPFRKEHFQEVELPGVSDLHRHVDSVQKQKSENEATLFKINSEFRSKSPISSFPDEWRLTTEGLRNDRPLSPSADEEEQIASSSQSSSRSSKSDLSQERNTPLKLRSVEEILKEMKSKEYAVSDPQPLPFEEKEIQSNIFGSTSRKNEHDLLTDLKSSIFPKSPTTPVSPVNKDQPPWERTGGDKYSVVNLFTSKYLKALKSSNKEKNKDKESNVRAKESVQSVPDTSMKNELQPPNQSSSAPMLSTSHKQSETASSRTHKYPHIDDTIHDDSESLSSTTEYSSKPRKMSETELKKVDEDQSVIPKLKSSTSQDIFEEKVSENKENSRPEKSISFSSEKSDVSMEPIQPVIPIKTSLPVLDTEKKFSPAALELKLTAELNYQEAIEESLRHIVGVERTQHVSQAQQETVSLAQLMKARQLEHEVEMEKITIKAKEEALEAERKRQQSEEKLKMKPSKSQGSYYGTSESQMRSRRSEEKISDYFDSNSTSPSRSSKADSYSITESISNDTRTDKDLDEHMKDAPIRKDKKSYSPRIKNMQKQRIIHRSDSDTESSITEEIFSSRKGSQDKLDLDKTLPSKKENQDSSDRSITEDIMDQSNQSSIHSDIGKTSKARKSDAGQTSDSSDTSLRFDEALTEDEIAEISRRVVVPSESHRRHQRRRATGSLDKSDLSSDEQLLSSARQKSFRGGATKGLDDFNIGSSLPGGTDNEFVHFMDQMVRQYMLEEEVRAKHQAAMLKLRERAIKEKSETELSWLEQVKKQVRNKGDDDKMPPIKKKQRAILLRLKLETAEIKKLKAVTKAASHERKMFLQQQKENAARRAKLRAAEEELDGEIAKVKSKSQESNLASNNSVPNIDLSNSPDLEDVSESNSELDTSSTSSVLMKKLKKQIPGVLDEHRLTKREQRLNQRKKQAEQLIAWKKKLDNEEKKVYNIEKKALSVWEKDPDNKSEKTKHPSFDSTENSRPKKLASKDELSIDESPSAKSPESEHHSSPPPPSRSESSIAEEISQLNSETNSSISAISPEQNNEKQRYQEELSDGTNAEYSQSFESLTASQKSPRSPKSRSEKSKVQKSKPAKSTTKVEDSSERKPGDTSPSATSLLPTKSRDEKRPILTSKKATGREQESALQRRESAESWSDESFSQTQSETEQSDIECRVRALKEELKRRRLIAERLKKEQKRRHKDRLKAQEASLRSQIEAYDVFIQKTQSELTQELDHQLNTNASHTAVSKPQIRSPRKSDQARQSARAIRSTTAAVVSPEASPRSGYQRPHVLGKHRTESESSGKSSRSLSFDDEEKTDEAATPNGSTKSFPGVVAPLPSKHQEKLLQLHSGISSSQHDGTISTASIPTDKSSEKLKRIDLTDSAATLSKLSGQVQTPVEASVTMPTPGVAIDKPKSLIPIPSKLPLSLSKSAPVISTTPTSSSLQPSPSASEQSAKLSKKSLIPIPISSSLDPSSVVAKQKGKSDLSPSSSLGSERSLEYSEHFESESTKTKDDDSIETDENISEHFSINSSATSSDKSAVLFNLPAHEETKKSLELNKEDSLQSVEDFENDQQDNDDNEKTPVMSPAHTPIPSSPRDAFPFQEQIDAPFHIGDTVCLAERENGIVRFVGKTSFAPGIWVGAELKGANGKNDGSVDGVRYFTCKPKHGIFAPIARVSLVSSKSKIEAGIKDIVKDDIEKDEKLSPKDEEHSQKDLKDDNDDKTAMKEPVLRSDFDRNRLAEELGDKLLNSLLEDSVTHILESHTDKQQRLSHGNENLSPEQEPEEEKQDLEDAGKASDDEDNVLLSASTKQLLEMLSSSPEQVEEPEEKNEPNEITSHESLADTFTGDLLKDTLIKVLEIRRQRVKKWQHMEENEEQPDKTFEEDSKLDDGHEVEDILEAKNRNSEYIEDEEKDSTTPVRPVSPIFGTSQDDGLDEWFEDDIGITGFHKKKPTISKDDVDFTGDEDDLWQDGRLIEVLSGRTEPVPPPKFVVPHKPGVILKLVKEATNYYYSKFLGGELLTDTQIPDFLFNVSSDDSSKDENSDKEIDEEKKEADLNADHIFKTSLFDMVRELITEIYNIKSSTEENLKRPLWLKKKTVCRPSYCRRMPETEDEIVKIVSKQVSKLLNLSNDPQKLDPKITMKWGSRRKKDKVDLILIQELREEEPEWTNYDEDETTVKMQLTDTVLDMLVSDTVHCLNNIQQKVTDRKTKDEHNDHDPEERSL
uniref:centrosome-associated protein 350-like isoform X2 n=1 Tax=Styela clava TaxID=7725 RepID=UPI001939C90C|nr:centrosome-associated protein 350-like isoform X2 [Styela clava]